MKDALRTALTERLGPRATATAAGLSLRPGSERELVETLAIVRDHGATLGGELALSREGLDQVIRVEPKAGLLEVGAGLLVTAVERVAHGHGMSLGPLPPSARAGTVAELLEGPLAGLRVVPGGRLEPVCAGLQALLPNGLTFHTPRAPRSATGPGLDALVLGGGGRAALVLSAVLRLFPAPPITEHVTVSFDSATELIRALRRAIDDGAWIWEAAVWRRASAYLLQATFRGTEAAAIRDANTLARRAATAGGRLTEADFPEPTAGALVERELSWQAVAAALAGTEQPTLRLHRVALDSVVASGTFGAMPARTAELEANDALVAAIVRAVDPEGVFGGASR